MSESPATVVNDLSVVAQTETPISQIKKDLFDPRTISKNKDQEGRDKLASEIRGLRQQRDELKSNIKKGESDLNERQNNTLVKIKEILHIPDKEKIDLETKLIGQRNEQTQLPNNETMEKMIDAYHEKALEAPLTNQEKRDLLKPEVLSQLSTDEYVALWKRLNPYFLSHVTRQAFRDHTGGSVQLMHTGGYLEFQQGFLNLVNDEKQLRPPIAVVGLKNRDEATIKMFLSSYVLQAENEEEAKKRFNETLHITNAAAPKYPDKTAIHFANQMVSNHYYGGEQGNEIFFVFPSDVVASQYDYGFNGRQKTFVKPQGEDEWNDVFVWPKSLENPGIPVDSGVVFLPEGTQVDPNTGSKYASEIKVIDGKEKRVAIEDSTLIDKYREWLTSIYDDPAFTKLISDYRGSYNNYAKLNSEIDGLSFKGLRELGFDQDARWNLNYKITSMWYNFGKQDIEYTFQNTIKGTSAELKRAENTIQAKDYWEKYFTEHPDQRPKHVIYYDGDPTNAIYKFQQENGIGSADTSKTEGDLLGFDDHHVTDMTNDPRANVGHKELVNLGNKIITEHYASR